jgi:ribosomal protein S27E
MNGCKHQSLIYAMATFLISCQVGTIVLIASISHGLFSKIMILDWNE